MSGTAVHMEGVRKSFAATRALDGIELDVPEGKVVALLGPNGAGKTTCMKILIGLLRPDAGTARVLGKDPWTARPEHRRRIGYLSEEGFAWPQLTFERAAAFASRFFPSWDAEFVARLAALLAISEDRRIGDMSRGQARKASLALVLGPKPEVLLLDDPASGLDPAARRDMIAAAADLLLETGATILFSSHILSDVERLADEVCVIAGGKVVLHRSLEELKAGARRVVLRAPSASMGDLRRLPGVVRARREEEAAVLTVLDFGGAWIEQARAALGTPVDGIRDAALGLEDLYLDIVAAPGGQEERP